MDGFDTLLNFDITLESLCTCFRTCPSDQSTQRDGPKRQRTLPSERSNVLFLQKAKTSKLYGEKQWCTTLQQAAQKFGKHTFEEVYTLAITLMERGALPELLQDFNIHNKKSLVVQRCMHICWNMRRATRWPLIHCVPIVAAQEMATERGIQKVSFVATLTNKPWEPCGRCILIGLRRV
jgi:hypothetical protein